MNGCEAAGKVGRDKNGPEPSPAMLAAVMDSQVAELRRGAILERDGQDRTA
jgi:hypothetical protein